MLKKFEYKHPLTLLIFPVIKLSKIQLVMFKGRKASKDK